MTERQAFLLGLALIAYCGQMGWQLEIRWIERDGVVMALFLASS